MSTPPGADQVFDNRQVLVSLVLQEQIVLGFVNESSELRPAIPGAPDQACIHFSIEIRAVPVGVEAIADFLDLSRIGRHHRLIARLGKVL
jgi:hypothetical protein